MATSHLAGSRVIIGSYVVQRCLICGEVLDEFNARDVCVEVNEDGDTAPMVSLILGGIYEIGDGNPRSMVLVRETKSPHFDSDIDLPDNMCIRKMNV